MTFLSKKILFSAFFSFLAIFFFSWRQGSFFHPRSQASGLIYVTSFTSSSYELNATGVGHTYVFVVPDTINAPSQNYIQLSLTTNADIGVSGQTSFCDASLGFLKDDGVTLSSVSLAAHNAQEGVCPGVTLSLPDSTTNIAAGSTMTASINGIKNPAGEGNFYPYITDSSGSSSEINTVPQQAFGTPLLKVTVTEPDGSTTVSGANVWVHNAFYNKSAGAQTDIAGNTFLFEDNFWLPPDISIGDTYTIEIEAPSGSQYTNAIGITAVSIVAGSTADYSSAGSGPITLTRPLVKGTVVVPSGCSTCNASAGSTITDVDIEVRDSSFNAANFTHTRVDQNGVFKVGGLSAASYIMEFMNPYDMSNYRGLMVPASIEFTVNADGSVTYEGSDTPAGSLPVDLGNVEFRLAAKTISGTVTRKDTGAPVANVRISAYKMMEPGMANTTTDENGQYALLVGGGSWSIMPEVDFSNNFNDEVEDITTSWIYCGMPKNATFADDTTTESAANTDFKVRTTSATITGTVYTPNGEALTGGNAGVSIFSKDGCGVHTSIDPYNGTFSADVPAGTYNVSIRMWDARYAAPAAKTVTVSTGTVDAGSFTMREYQASISGRLWADANSNGSYDSGEGVGNIRVEAFKVGKKFDEFAGPGPGGGGPMGGPMGGGDFASTQSSNDTATKGNFQLRVTQGTWIVNVMSDPGMMGGYSSTSTNYIYTGAPLQVNIQNATDTSSGHDFELKIADATIQGRLVNSVTSEGIDGIYGYAFAEPSNSLDAGPMMGMGMGAPVNNSAFTIKVPAGDYNIGVDFPPETAGYTPSDMTTVTAVSGQTVTVDVPVLENNATIKVRFKDDAGNLITDLTFAEVFMNNGAGGHQWRLFSSADLANGFTNISVAPGTWNIGYHIDPTETNYMSSPVADNKVTVQANQTITKDITLKVADSTVSGTVYDPSGSPLAGVFVSLDSRKATGFSPDGGPMFMQGEMTGADGTYSLSLPAGTYQVAAFYPPSAVVNGQTVAYLNPAPQEVTISPTSPATVNFTFKQSDAVITGNITLNGSAQGAFVTAYSNNGGYNETTSTNGSYSLNVTSGTIWHIKAFYETGNTLYHSPIQDVDLTSSTSASQNLALAQAPFTIPDPVSTTFNCANAKKITLSNGAEISIPASAIKPSSIQSCSANDSSSNITVTISPTAQMSLQDKSIPIGVGYEITAKDSNGSVISDTFSSNITIVIPYTDNQISDSVGGAVNESLLGNGYWDTSTSTWRSVNSQTIDTENNTLTISTNHFTLFGILAATDASTVSGSTSSTSSTSSGPSSTDSTAAAPRDQAVVLERANHQMITMIGVKALPYDADIDGFEVSQGFVKPRPPLWLATPAYQLKLIARYNGQEFHQFDSPITLILRYDPTALGGIPENSLRLNYYDTAHKRWYPLNSVLITDRHQVAVVLPKNHGIYALIGGYGYQGASYSVNQTVTATATSDEIGISDSIISDDLTPSPTSPPAPTASAPSPKPLPVSALPKLNFFQKILRFVKSLF